VPAAGVYTNTPGTLAVALSCVAVNVVPYEIVAGVFHVMIGLSFRLTVIRTCVPTTALKFTKSVGVKSTEST